jgi:pyruvate/2-oxoglutarate dehydrogenase complex dihydrolipoamide dehydrogenase (E3) component
MADRYDYDLVVVGAGSAGLIAATYACRLGAAVALVEKARVGGDCTWTGCVPSKALIHLAHVAQAAQLAREYGVGSADKSSRADMQRVRAYIERAISDVYSQESPELLQAEGIDMVQAEARFLDPHTLQVGERTLTGKAFVLCTGAGPSLPQVPGLASVRFLTYEQLFSNGKLPEHLVVVGGGPTGVEMAQAYRRLGARVTVIAPRLLSREEPEARSVLESVFAQEGIEWVRGRASAFRNNGDSAGAAGSIIVAAGEREVGGDMLLVATGRAPNVQGMALEKAGVRYSPKGIRVNSQLQTSAEHIYAAGDCTGGPQFTHYAGWQGFQAVRNALLLGSSSGVSDAVPWVTYTDPEIAHVGSTEAQARGKHGGDLVATVRKLDRADRAITDNSCEGFIKLVHRKDGTLLGASVVAPRAGEVISELALALAKGLKTGDLAGTIHPYPTYSTPLQQMASDVAFDSFLCSVPGKVIRRLSGLPAFDSVSAPAQRTGRRQRHGALHE